MATQPEPEVEKLIEQLWSEHEELRLRRLELLQLLEDEVTARLEWEDRAASLQRELDAIRSSRVMRLTAALRRLRTKLMRRG